MTDEEMAEEWVKENSYPYNDCPTIQDKLKRTFLAGLKAGRPQWHNLREDPNDLPKRVCYVLNQAGTETAYRPDRGFLGFGGIRVVAWCEIPKFEEAKQC